MESTAQLLWGVVLGSIGLGFFIYGKKQKAIVPLIVGIVLMILPYFISNGYLLAITGAVLVILPYFIRL